MPKKEFKSAVARDLIDIPQEEAQPIEEETTDKKENLDSTSKNTLINVLPNVKANTLSNANPNVFSDLLDSIAAEVEPAGANYTFYLSADTAKAITNVAKAKGISKSKLVDGILNHVLLGTGVSQ